MRPEYIPVLIASATFLGTLAAVVIGFIYNNGRMTDLRAHLDARLTDHYTAFSTRLDDFHADLQRLKDHPNLK